MAAAYSLLVFEAVVIAAMGAVWGIHRWGSKELKSDLKSVVSVVRHRLFDGHPRPF